MRFCVGCFFHRLSLSEKPCPFCGKVFEPYAPRTGEKLHPLVRFVRWLLQPIGWPTHIVTIAATLLFLWDSSRGNISFMPQLILGCLTLIVAVIWIGRLPVRCVIAACYKRAPWAYRAGWKNWLVAPILLALSLILYQVDVPIRIAFLMSRPAMEQLARQAQAAPKLKLPPRRTGAYYAEDIEILGGGIRFVAVKSSFIFTESLFGFAYFPGGMPPASSPRKFADWNSGAEYKSLGNNWFYWKEFGSNF